MSLCACINLRDVTTLTSPIVRVPPASSFVCVVGVFAAVWVADLLDVQPYNKPTGQLVFMAFVHFCEIMCVMSVWHCADVWN